MSPISKDQLLCDIAALRLVIAKLGTSKVNLLDAGSITLPEFEEINDDQILLEIKLNRLHVALINSILTELSIPGESLKTATQRLDDALENFESARKILSAIAQVINVINRALAILI